MSLLDPYETDAELTLDLVSQVVDYAIIGLDPQGTIRSWNAGAQRLKGYSADEVLGRHFSIFYGDEDRTDGLPQDLLDRARTDGRVEHTGWRVRRDGTRFWGVVVITALHDDDGALTGYAKVTRDRSDQHRVEELQSSLVAMMSHDIRQPLTAIGLHASAITTVDPSRLAEHAERILVSAEQLESMINTMFDHARVRAGAVPIHPEPIALEQALHEAVDAHRYLLSDRRVSVTETGVVARADPVALRRVLANLLINAVKYSPDDSPIELSADADGDRAVFRVADHGRGVAAEDIPVIFDEFVRGRYAVDDGGTGLGLASVKFLVEQQGGTVRMDSTPGEGTTVTVSLPHAD